MSYYEKLADQFRADHPLTVPEFQKAPRFKAFVEASINYYASLVGEGRLVPQQADDLLRDEMTMYSRDPAMREQLLAMRGVDPALPEVIAPAVAGAEVT